jgi:CHAT domain-containing protein/predicted negative regulator of RcsB-dependent stress response
VRGIAILGLFAAVVAAQTPAAVKELAGRIAAAKTDAEFTAILDSTPHDQLAAAARETATQAFQRSQMGDQSAAMTILARAEGAAERSADLGTRAFCAYWHSVILVTSGDLEGALRHSRESVVWAQDTQPSSGLHQVACDALRQLDDFRDAIPECEQALIAARKFGPPIREGQVLNSLGLLYHAGGQYRLALENYEQAVKLAEAVKQNDFIANLKHNLGNLQMAQGNFDLARRYYEESLAIKRAGGAKRQIVTTVIQLAGLGISSNNRELVNRYLPEAFQLAEETSNRPLLAFCHKQRAQVEMQDGKLEAAIADLRLALEGASPLDSLVIRITLGTALLRNRDVEGALQYALAVRKDAEEAGHLEAARESENLLGKIYLAQRKTDEAEAAFRRSIAGIEDLRANIAGVEEDRQRYLQDKLEPYRSLFSLLAASGRTGEAFAAAEQTKARVLAEVIGSGKLRITHGMTPAEQEREESLKRRLAAARQARGPNARAEVDRAAAQYSEFQAELYAAHPELALRRTTFAPAKPAEIAAELPNARAAAVEYAVLEDAVYAMVIVGGDPSVHFYKLAASPKAIAEKASAFRAAAASRDIAAQTLARELYQVLLAPLKEVQRKTSLVFVPDGPLWQVPFQALQPAAGRYLIQDAAVSYAPSMTVLAEIRRRGARPGGGAPTVLALGDPALAPGSGMAPLPFAKQEVTGIGQLYGAANSRVLTGARADKAAVSTGSYSVLHLATHGVLDARNPMYSRLYLAPHGDDPGILEAWEVMGLELHEDVVVLSACELASGKVGDGEGLLGMSWAMFVAGSPTTVASHWKVDDATTSALMIEFHRALLAKAGKAEALRRAALASLAKPETRHPFYWAAFAMMGDGQ